MLVKAKDVLEYLIDIKSNIFSNDVISRAENYINVNVITENFLLCISKKAEQVINDFVLAPSPDSSEAFLSVISVEVLVAIFLRFEYFEETMRRLSSLDANVELHSASSKLEDISEAEAQSDHEDFLRFGLIDLWNRKNS